MSQLAHHNALVTGAGSGIGRAIALRLAAGEAHVLVNDINGGAAEATAEAIRAAGGSAEAVEGDVSKEADIDRIFRTCEKTWGTCSLVVNNAGISQRVRLTEMTVADFDRMIAVHLRGCFLGCHRAIPAMLDMGRGIIVNIASQLGQVGREELVHYSAAKAGIIGLTKALAREVGPLGIRVNAVAPGPINTDLLRRVPDEWRRAKAEELPLGRFGEPEDVAATVAFLASDDAGLYVGQTLGPNSGDVML